MGQVLVPLAAGERAAFSRPGYEVPAKLLKKVRAMTFHSLTTATQASRDYVKERVSRNARN